MLSDYIQSAMELAHHEIIEDDNTYLGTIKEFEGLWASGETLEKCRRKLQETLEDWLLISLRLNKPIPSIKGIDLTVKSVA